MCMGSLMNRVRFDVSYLPIRDELDFALMQAFQKERVVIECIELSYGALDALIATDPSRMSCKSANSFKWRAIKLKPSDSFTPGGSQYRLSLIHISEPTRPY